MAKVQIKSEKLTPFGGIFSIMEKFDSMLNTDDEDALGEELIEMAGVKEIYKKSKKDDSDDYVI